MSRNLYEVLGVDPEVAPEQIQAAYVHWARRLASDRDSGRGEAFTELQQAYSVLASPARREAYNTRIGRPASSGGEPFRTDPGTPAKEHTPTLLMISLRDSFESANPSFEELFHRLWSNFSKVSRPKAEQVESLTLEVTLSPEQAREGGRARILIPARALCPACAGHGALGLYECWQCGGKGSITADYPVELAYPPGVLNEFFVQVPLSRFGINNFYLTVRFRVSEEAV